MAKAFETDQPPPEESKKANEIGGKFNLPAFDNRAQTGTSIAQGNYLNLAQANSNQPNKEPISTWQKVQQDPTVQNFYANAFNLNQNKKREAPDGVYQPPYNTGPNKMPV